MATRARRVEPGLALLARLGFVARGVVTLVMGAVAARAAVLQRGRVTGPQGALRHLLNGWHGPAVLSAVAAGLFAFVLFRVAQARRAPGRLAAAGYLVSAVGAFVLALGATRLLLTPGGASPAVRAAAAWLLARDLGRDVLAAAGAVATVAGAVEIARAFLGKLPRDFTAAVIARRNRTWITRLARLGLLAHGVVLSATGGLVFRAARDPATRSLPGTGRVIRTLAGAYGPFFLAALAAGLLAYGLSLVVLAAHGRRSLR